MSRKHWTELAPSLVLASGIVLSTLVAVLPMAPGWRVGAGALLLTLSILGADMLSSRLRGESPVPSPVAIVVASAYLVTCGIVALRDPALIAMLIPILGGGASAILLPRRGRSGACERA